MDIKESPITYGLLARRLELSVLMTPGRRKPYGNVSFFSSIQPPQHRSSSNSGAFPPPRLVFIQEPFQTLFTFGILGLKGEKNPCLLPCSSSSSVLPPQRSENCSSACYFYCIFTFTRRVEGPGIIKKNYSPKDQLDLLFCKCYSL